MDIVFILDTSVSVDWNEWYDFRRGVANIIEGLGTVGPRGHHVAVISYSHVASVAYFLDAFNTKREAINGVMNGVPHYNYTTKTDAGLNLACTIFNGGPGDRTNENIAIIVTDGRSQTDITSASANLHKVAKVLAVGIDLADNNQLKILAGHVSENWWKFGSFKELLVQGDTILDAFCP